MSFYAVLKLTEQQVSSDSVLVPVSSLLLVFGEQGDSELAGSATRTRRNDLGPSAGGEQAFVRESTTALT